MIPKLFFILLFISTLAFGQTRQEVKEQYLHAKDPETIKKNLPENGCRIYKSYDDYLQNKFIVGERIEPNSYEMIMGSKTIKVTQDGKIVKKKISDYNGKFISDEQGMCMRVDDGFLYIIVLQGPYCYYFRDDAASVSKSADGSFYIARKDADHLPMPYYSQTLSGEIISKPDKVLDELLEKYGLTDAYKSDKPKREMKDSVDDYNNKVQNRDIKYFAIINEKISGKQ